MLSKYFATVEVKTYLKIVQCPNGECTGNLKSDGKQRSSDGLQGGVPEYRHICDKCNAGAWLLQQYPIVEYVPVPKTDMSGGN